MAGYKDPPDELDKALAGMEAVITNKAGIVDAKRSMFRELLMERYKGSARDWRVEGIMACKKAMKSGMTYSPTWAEFERFLAPAGSDNRPKQMAIFDLGGHWGPSDEAWDRSESSYVVKVAFLMISHEKKVRALAVARGFVDRPQGDVDGRESFISMASRCSGVDRDRLIEQGNALTYDQSANLSTDVIAQWIADPFVELVGNREKSA